VPDCTSYLVAASGASVDTADLRYLAGVVYVVEIRTC
jgi:hypothetical protein